MIRSNAIRNEDRSYRLLLFDLDGVLADTRPVMEAAWAAVRRECGVSHPFSAYFAEIGRPFPDIMDRLGLRERSDEIEAVYSGASVRSLDLTGTFPGMPDTLKEIQRRGILTGVVTSKTAERTQLTLDLLGMRLDTVRTPGTWRGKPAPDALLLAMVDVGVDPEQTVYIGDMAVDQEAARRAGAGYAHASWGYGSPRVTDPHVLLGCAEDLLKLPFRDDHV